MRPEHAGGTTAGGYSTRFGQAGHAHRFSGRATGLLRFNATGRDWSRHQEEQTDERDTNSPFLIHDWSLGMVDQLVPRLTRTVSLRTPSDMVTSASVTPGGSSSWPVIEIPSTSPETGWRTSTPRMVPTAQLSRVVPLGAARSAIAVVVSRDDTASMRILRRSSVVLPPGPRT